MITVDQYINRQILSDLYIYPPIKDVNISYQKTPDRVGVVDSSNPIIKIERFSTDFSTMIASGSFGQIYKSNVDVNELNPLLYKKGKYVMKVVRLKAGKTSPHKHVTLPLPSSLIKNTQLETNIQNLISKLNNKYYAVPYIYNVLFMDRNRYRLGIFSELIDTKGDTLTILMCGKDNVYNYNNGANVKLFTDVLEKLKKIVMKDTVALYIKHNDMHFGNVLLHSNSLHDKNIIDLDFKIIDFGFTYVKNSDSQPFNTSIINYMDDNKIIDIMKLFNGGIILGNGVLPSYTSTFFNNPQNKNSLMEEFKKFSTLYRPCDYLLYEITLISIIQNKATTLSNRGLLQIAQANGWGTFFEGLLQKYSFLDKLSVNNDNIIYDSNIIVFKNDYQFLYYYMRDLIHYLHHIHSNFGIFIKSWNIAEFRIIVLFIIIYMSLSIVESLLK